MESNENGDDTNCKKHPVGNVASGIAQWKIIYLSSKNEVPKGTDDNVAEDRKLFVGGLSRETREPQLKEYFEKYGEVEFVNLKKLKNGR